jgi:hypothetical protein
VSIIFCDWDGNESLMILMKDISRKIQIENLTKINKYKDNLLATVTHDIKTPLNSMI